MTELSSRAYRDVIASGVDDLVVAVRRRFAAVEFMLAWAEQNWPEDRVAEVLQAKEALGQAAMQIGIAAAVLGAERERRVAEVMASAGAHADAALEVAMTLGARRIDGEAAYRDLVNRAAADHVYNFGDLPRGFAGDIRVTAPGGDDDA